MLTLFYSSFSISVITNKKIKEELFIRQKIGCEIESVSAITQIGDGLCCIITYKDFHKPNEFYSYYT